MDLVLDLGNSRLKGGLFEAKTLSDTFVCNADSQAEGHLLRFLEGKSIQRALLSSVNSKTEAGIKSVLTQRNIPFHLLDYAKLTMIFDVDEPEQLGQDRIANAYGALARFPLNDCIVVDIGTAVTIDFVAKEGRYLGGMIYAGGELCAKALASFTDKLPLIALRKPESALAKTTETHLQSGIYYGQLGALERMIDEIRLCAISPSSIKVIATGGAITAESIEDLQEFVDIVDPHLTLLGLCEILANLKKE